MTSEDSLTLNDSHNEENAAEVACDQAAESINEDQKEDSPNAVRRNSTELNDTEDAPDYESSKEDQRRSSRDRGRPAAGDQDSGRDNRRREGKSVLVKNLRFETPTREVRRVFETVGPIRDVYLPVDFHTQRPRGFGFVEFLYDQDAAEAIKQLDGTEIDGNYVTVLLAQDRRRQAGDNSNRTSGRRDTAGSRDRRRSRSRSPDRSYGRSSRGRDERDNGRNRAMRGDSYRDDDRHSRGGRGSSRQRDDQDRRSYYSDRRGGGGRR